VPVASGVAQAVPVGEQPACHAVRNVVDARHEVDAARVVCAAGDLALEADAGA